MNQKFPDVSPSKGNLVKTILQNLTKSTKKTSSTIRWGKSFLIVQPLLAGILLFSGCNDPETLPVDVLPNGDELLTVFSDTSTIINRILVEDSLQTDELSASLLGNINDANFGVTTASIYTQVNLAGTPAFGTTPIADSLVLILGYDGYYGDTTESQTVNVYHLTSDLSTDNKMAPHLRIRLDNSLADSILAQNGTVNLTTNTLWLAYFKGLKIEATPTASLGKGSISYFNFFNSSLTIYFHNDTVPKKYNFSLLNARTNNFTHDYTGTPVETLLNSGTTDSLCYVSANGGVKL